VPPDRTRVTHERTNERKTDAEARASARARVCRSALGASCRTASRTRPCGPRVEGLVLSTASAQAAPHLVEVGIVLFVVRHLVRNVVIVCGSAASLLAVFDLSGRHFHVLPADASGVPVMAGAVVLGVLFTVAEQRLRRLLR